jgi:hypothetical protein
MAVQQEIKSQLAKLLATEDLVVEHKHVETAQFNVQTRVLILPLWEKASNDVYDMLVGHEVGHALFTPNEDPPKDVPHSFMNVVEDARIEKLMKRKYLGIAKSFYRGYSEMHEDDFFELDGEDITKFNLADRANLHFKIGSFLPIPFSPPEKEIISLIQNAETFTDTITAAKALYNYCKQEKEEESQVEQSKELEAESDALSDIEGSGGIDTDSSGDTDPTVSDTDSDAPVESGIDSVDSDFGMDDSGSPVEPEVRTEDVLNNRIKDLTGSEHSYENVYVEIPKVNLDTIIIKNDVVHNAIDAGFVRDEESFVPTSDDLPEHLQYLYSPTCFYKPDTEFNKFKKDAKKEVNYLVKEFESRKAASSYARATTSRTGVLDTTKLHTYRYNEDLFKKITVLPDGKNHGLVFILDWSGSMQYVLQDTLKQLFNLIWFCKKVQIPFEVYAFTNEWNRRGYGCDADESLKSHYEAKEGLLAVEEHFNLLNVLTHKVNGKTLEHQMLNLWRNAYAFANRCCYNYTDRMRLSGTPLNETMIALHQILPQFKKDNNVEKVQCIVLTDGEGSQIPYHKMVERHWEPEPYLGVNGCSSEAAFLRDRKLGKTYKLGYGYHQFTDALIKNLRDRFTSTNFIGIRVMSSRDAKHFIGLYYHGWQEREKISSDWRKNKSLTITNSGYHAYFGLSSATLAQDAEFDVDESATKAQIKRAFVKSLKTKKLNKKVLSEFIELVA